jgi:hypothetical protein
MTMPDNLAALHACDATTRERSIAGASAAFLIMRSRTLNYSFPAQSRNIRRAYLIGARHTSHLWSVEVGPSAQMGPRWERNTWKRAAPSAGHFDFASNSAMSNSSLWWPSASREEITISWPAIGGRLSLSINSRCPFGKNSPIRHFAG